MATGARGRRPGWKRPSRRPSGPGKITSGMEWRCSRKGVRSRVRRGIDQLAVSARPTVAVFTTGDELVEPGLPLQRGEIYNSNRTLLWACYAAKGSSPTRSRWSHRRGRPCARRRPHLVAPPRGTDAAPGRGLGAHRALHRRARLRRRGSRHRDAARAGQDRSPIRRRRIPVVGPAQTASRRRSARPASRSATTASASTRSAIRSTTWGRFSSP